MLIKCTMCLFQTFNSSSTQPKNTKLLDLEILYVHPVNAQALADSSIQKKLQEETVYLKMKFY